MIKNIFLVTACLMLVGSLFAQTTITGRVRDAKTSEPLPFANIYINNTTVGVAANAKGEYELNNVPEGLNEVVFSFVGYETYTTKVIVTSGLGVKLDIRLKQDERQLENVSVSATKDKEWNKRLKRFERVFLGATKTAADTKILNPWVIELNEEKKNGVKELTALSTQPIEIENLALGYKIFYDLKAFVSTNEYYRFNGNIFFKDIITVDSVQAAKWTKNRLDVYHGSMRHLFKSILDNRVTEEGFLMYAFKLGLEKNVIRSTVFAQDLNQILSPYNPSGFFLPGKHPGEFMIPMKPRIEVHYLNAITSVRTYRDVVVPVAGLELYANHIEVNQNGILLNPAAVLTSGYFGESRVADFLPYDYTPGTKSNFISLKPPSKDEVNLDRLQEKVYLHTDKTYYNQGDVVWFKGYMKYNYPEILDSLSAVLYVDLISPDHKVLQSKLFSIDSGRVVGDLALPTTLAPGNYCLRAYTNWMRNYSEKDFFMKALPVINFYDNLEKSVGKSIDSGLKNEIEIRTNQETYHPRDSIALSVTIRDQYDNPVVADLSISVTDAEQIVSLPYEPVITRFSKIENNNSKTKNEKTFPVEHGVSFGGYFRNDKGKPEKMKVTIVQGNLEDMTTVDTDDLGNFWTNGFLFSDSVEFGFRAVNPKGKSYGKISLSKNERPAVPDSLPFLILPFRKTEFKDKKYQQYQDSGPVRVLQEVVINSTKIEERRPFTRFGTPDYTINGDVFANTSYMNLIYEIQGRIPGLRLIMMDGKYYVLLGGVSSLQAVSNSEPLLLIDGLAFNGSDGILDMINSITPSNILRVDVFKFGGSAMFGARGANGVIAIYTKNGAPQKEQVKGYDKKLFQLHTINGFTKPKQFKSPSYAGALRENTEPDFRATVYWNPLITTNHETGEAVVSFYAADLETKYRVVLEGMTSLGEPIYAEYFITVAK